MQTLINHIGSKKLLARHFNVVLNGIDIPIPDDHSEASARRDYLHRQIISYLASDLVPHDKDSHITMVQQIANVLKELTAPEMTWTIFLKGMAVLGQDVAVTTAPKEVQS